MMQAVRNMEPVGCVTYQIPATLLMKLNGTKNGDSRMAVSVFFGMLVAYLITTLWPFWM
jgi:hypothetical protein